MYNAQYYLESSIQGLPNLLYNPTARCNKAANFTVTAFLK